VSDTFDPEEDWSDIMVTIESALPHMTTVHLERLAVSFDDLAADCRREVEGRSKPGPGSFRANS
jgi:hypothetical protein